VLYYKYGKTILGGIDMATKNSTLKILEGLEVRLEKVSGDVNDIRERVKQILYGGKQVGQISDAGQFENYIGRTSQAGVAGKQDWTVVTDNKRELQEEKQENKEVATDASIVAAENAQNNTPTPTPMD